jgi:hypothetical protein
MFTQNQKFVFNLKSACDNTDISFRDNMSTLELALYEKRKIDSSFIMPDRAYDRKIKDSDPQFEKFMSLCLEQ